MIERIEEILADGRSLSLRKIDGKYIATAIPIEFRGGPVPTDWRREGKSIEEVVRALDSYRETPGDFQWYDEEGNDIPDAACY